MKKVLFIDSGSGGINILKECIKVCPRCDFLFFCDNKNMPYGNKTKEELLSITFENLEMIYRFFKFEIVVFACNSLTSTCIVECREKYPNVEFVGTVPAIKPALEKFDREDVLVLATQATADHNILIEKTKVPVLVMQNLASMIDENLDEIERLYPQLDKQLEGINAKAIVLGCTHYVAIKKHLEECFPNVEIFDGANGVARRLASIVGEGKEDCQVQMMVSGDETFLAKLIYFFEKQQ